MKKHLLAGIFFLFLLQQGKAQMVYMPDSMLRLRLTNLGLGGCIVGDSIDAGCPMVQNCNSLNLYNAGIYSLEGIQVFISLRVLDCSFNSLSQFPNLPSQLEILECDENNITSIQNLPDSLKTFYCRINNITSLPFFLPNNLEELYCSDNLLPYLPNLPNSLTVLECASNYSLLTLPSLPLNLQVLNTNGDFHLTTLPVLPQLLRELDCNQCQISNLPLLPDSLTRLDCKSDLITAIPNIPSQLTYLDCSNNHLLVLQSLPNNLNYLICSSDSLTSLPNIPTQLNYLDCSNNQITTLQQLPNQLATLNINNNDISTIPNLPGSITRLDCASNIHLTFIPPLPDSLSEFVCSNDSSLFCLPQLTFISILNFINSPISCIPNYGNVVSSTPLLNSLPLCDLFNTNNCNFFWNISGKSFFDTDTNCVQSNTEPGLSTMHLNLYDNGTLVQQAFTGGEGFYSFDVNSFGNYKVELDTSAIPFTSVCPATNNYLDTVSVTDSLFYNNDFSLKCKNGFDVGVWSIVTSGFRPVHRSVVNIRAGDIANFYGVHCAGGISGTLTVTINGNAHYYGTVSGAMTPSSVIGNVITYNISDYDLINSNTDFAFELETDTNATPGSQICIDATISPLIGDNNISNNSITQCFTVRASYDPNEKEVYPEGVTDTSQHWLTYTIHFQNTGNAPALNIYLLDTLDNNLDISTFQLLVTSHLSYVQILDGGIAKFNFPNINLPDSFSNEPMSHGYVQYKIKLKNNLLVGTHISNTAYIYFDFNSPVVTNTTSNTIDIVSGINSPTLSHTLNVWPVPFDDGFIVDCDSFLKGSKFSIINLMGSEMISGTMKDSQMKISTIDWTSGIYFLRLEMKDGMMVRKLVKR